MLTGAEPLDERKQKILSAIVHDYTSTAEPVSSEMLAYRCRLGIKPATIRNEMAEMSDLGYLRQPHTSAGRVPSDLGYRFYVDRLMSGPGVSSADEDKVAEAYRNAVAELDSILHLTCRILSSLTDYTSVAALPMTAGSTVCHVGVSPLSPRKLLLVVVVSDGRVEHSILELPADISVRKTSALSNIITRQFRGMRVSDLTCSNVDSVPPEAAGMLAEYRIVIRAIKQLIHEDTSGSICVEGAGNIISQPEFKDVAKLEALLTALFERRAIFHTLKTAFASNRAEIIIGSENPCSEMRDCSWVTAHFRIGNRPCGVIGVIGPTRMNYRRAVGAVNLLAQSLSELLAGISVG